MKGTCDAVLKEIERRVNNINGHNVAASIATRLLNQDRYRCSSIAHNLPMLLQMPSGAPVLACLYPSIRQHVQHLYNIYDYREDVQHTVELMNTKVHVSAKQVS